MVDGRRVMLWLEKCLTMKFWDTLVYYVLWLCFCEYMSLGFVPDKRAQHG